MIEEYQPTVNFYILPDSDLQNRLFFVFRLIEKAVEQQLPTAILTADETQTHHLDRLIWTARPTRFIPHDILTDSNNTIASNVVICDKAAYLKHWAKTPQLIIDLSYNTVPLNYPKVMLIANQHSDILPNARMKYRSYVDQGIKPAVHKISEKWLSV